ncbi:tigger transposable element-derived protein 1 [Trichonephila clavipes]|nr:tigger transposable element-derived protein 1 [Trichonephila clavipes]
MKALKFYKELKESEPSTSSRESNPQFSASTGWLTGFIKRHSFHNLKIKGEVASADEEAARKYPEKLAKIIKDGEYCAHQVFNADETGLFWKKIPTRTYIAKSEKTASGFKAAKDRVTLLLCSNASGDRMLKPLLVNRSLKPRALKGKDLNTLPVHWMANKKAWVTTAIFTEWFNKCFVPEVENYMNEMGLEFKILLILDNAPDQGIISTFKKYYVKFTFQFIFDKLESETITVTEAWKQFNILNCVNHVALAIAEIKSQTLNACWKAAWPECVSKGNESNRAIVTSEIISIAKEIGGEGFDDFGEHDIEELLVDEALNDDNILESMVDITKDLETVDSEPEEDVTPLDEKLLREGLQLSGKLANFFIQNDNDVERALKFQRDLKFCMSGYRELYKELVPSQSLITDYLVKEKKITEVPEEALPCRSDDVILSSSDESDLAPIHKRVRTLSDSE